MNYAATQTAVCGLYADALIRLNEDGVPYLVGGAFAGQGYTGIARDTKDFDLFLRRRDVERARTALETIGCQTKVLFPHWLAKAYTSEGVIDLIYGSGNGIAVVDDGWFKHAVDATIFDVPVKLCPPEETIWSKAFIMERERYDGNDVAHLLRARGRDLDWNRVLRRFGPHWRVLLSHLVLFGFVYPAERTQIPRHVQDDLLRRLQSEAAATPPADKTCQGTLISRAQYLVDIGPWGYRDARLEPGIKMTPADIAHWTRAIEADDKATKPQP
jgi:hypothetical protein